MKSHILFLTSLCVFIFLSAQMANASNTLEIVGGQTNVNDTAIVSVNMENDSLIVAFQIDIPIPSQLSYNLSDPCRLRYPSDPG